ncbi:MAG TPA: hypothetical protein VLJ11_15370 [Bryobacteraceae bacterium]|nr:hypothetical protein [Bryobacteraceae bacterium]
MWLVLVFTTATLSFAAPAVNPAFAPLQQYEGTWQVTRTESGTPAAKPYRLVNRCVALGIYFACEQTIDNKPTALRVFIPAGSPGRYHTQSILPEGRATGLDSLEVAGNRWTFTSRRQEGGNITYFRSTNVFLDKNHIHFESAQSPDGKQWTVQISGEQSRVPR